MIEVACPRGFLWLEHFIIEASLYIRSNKDLAFFFVIY